MRRASIITISIMFAIIVGLTGALVYTNLPDAEETQSQTVQNNESQTDESSDEIVAETPTEVSLDSDIVADMYEMVSNGSTSFLGSSFEIFHYFKKGSITIDDLDNEDIQTAAYFYKASQEVEDATVSDNAFITGTLSTDAMDSVVKALFGDVEYEYTCAYMQEKTMKAVLEYDEEAGVYYRYGGFGGGSNSGPYTAISKVEEYSDRYEVTEKFVYLSYYDGTDSWGVYPWYGVGIIFSGRIDTSLTRDDIANMTNSKGLYSTSEDATKILSAYYDEATEYKHTFMKNEDGTYYWVKTEIVK